jgi:hypothetical protein
LLTTTRSTRRQYSRRRKIANWRDAKHGFRHGRQGRNLHRALLAALATTSIGTLIRVGELHSQLHAQECGFHLRHFLPATTPEVARKIDFAVAHTNQPTYRHTHSLEHAAHFTIAAFRNDGVIPVV